jgi:Tfp pilus assembly protein PilF
MRNPKKYSICRLVVVATMMTLGCGCHTAKTDSSAIAGSPQVQVDRPDDPANLSDAQRTDQFYYSYETGMNMIQRGQYAHAMGAFEEALRMNPSSTEAMFNLAACYDSIGDPLRAIPIYRRLLSETPNDADCHANLGTAFIKMYHRERSPGWRKMAWDSWNRSLQLNPEQPEIRRYLEQSKLDN